MMPLPSAVPAVLACGLGTGLRPCAGPRALRSTLAASKESSCLPGGSCRGARCGARPAKLAANGGSEGGDHALPHERSPAPTCPLLWAANASARAAANVNIAQAGLSQTKATKEEEGEEEEESTLPFGPQRTARGNFPGTNTQLHAQQEPPPGGPLAQQEEERPWKQPRNPKAPQ